MLDARNTTPPGPTCIHSPLISASIVPDLTISISSLGCLCGAWGAPPGFRVVICTSRFFRVAVGPLKTLRTDPESVGFAGMLSQVLAQEPFAGASAAAANPPGATAA